MNTLTWKINQLEAYPQFEGQENVVFTVHWDLVGSDEANNTGRVYGSVGVTLDAEAPFTPFEQLTEEQVIGWVKEALGAETVAAHEAAVAGQIAEAKTPSVVNPPLPWTAQPAPVEPTPVAPAV